MNVHCTIHCTMYVCMHVYLAKRKRPKINVRVVLCSLRMNICAALKCAQLGRCVDFGLRPRPG